LTRSGDVANGEKLLDDARKICLDAKLSNEALSAAETFQTAAEAYIQYKKKAYHKAITSLINSLEFCRVLNNEYGYSMEMRRVHLARNIVRVESSSNNLGEAMKLASSMVRYLEGDDEFWPFCKTQLWTKGNSLTSQEKWCCIDEILMEISLLLNKPKTVSKELLRISEPYLFKRNINNDSEFLRVNAWLAAMHAYVEDNVGVFLDNVAIFFSEGSDYMQQAWQEILLSFVKTCKEIDPKAITELNIDKN
jgi:hypothetical protein